jgi:hypothetical protein
MKNILDFFTNYWEVISPLVGIILLRIIPTEKNYCIVEALMKFLNAIVPNNRKKVLPFALLMLISTLGMTQQVGVFKAIDLVNVTDSTTVNLVNATLFYNQQTHLLKAYENGVTRNLLFRNTAANTELMRSNGSYATPSGLFIPSLGNLSMGSSSLSGTARTITALGSGTDLNLNFATKGTGQVFMPASAAPTSGLSINPNGSGGTSTTIKAVGQGTVTLEGSNSASAGGIVGITGGTTSNAAQFGGDAYVSAGPGTTESHYGQIYLQGNTLNLGLSTHTAVTSLTLQGAPGNSTSNNAMDFTIKAGNGYIVGNGNGGNLTISSGTKNGSGTDGNISINPGTGTTNLSGIVTTTTQSANNNSTRVATTAYVNTIAPFMVFSGPATSTKTFTLPNISSTILTNNTTLTSNSNIDGAFDFNVGQTTPITNLNVAVDPVGGAVISTDAGTTGLSIATDEVNLVTASGGSVAISGGGAVVITGSTIQIGTAGSAFNEILSTTATLNFPSTAAGAVSDLTISVSGAAINNSVFVGPPAAGPTKGGYLAWVSSAGTVTVRYFNNDLTTAVDPASATFRVTVFVY